MGSTASPSEPPSIDVSVLYVHPDGVSICVNTKSCDQYASGTLHRSFLAGKRAQAIAPSVCVDGVAWSQLDWPQPHILRIYSLPQGAHYELRVVRDGSQHAIHLLSPSALAREGEKGVPWDTHTQQAFQDIERTKERLASQALRWEQKIESLQEQVQLLKADETEKKGHIAVLHRAVAEAEKEVMEHQQQQKHWAHELQERMSAAAAAAELEKQTLHELEREAAEAEQAAHDTQALHGALQAELRQLEAQWARERAGAQNMRSPQEWRPSPMQVHTLQLHRRTASLRETAHRSLSEGWRSSLPVQAAQTPRSASFHFPFAPRDDMEG